MANSATETAQEAVSTAQERAVELKEQGRNKLGQTLDERTTEVGTQARRMAHALRNSSDQLRTQGEGMQVAGIAESAADRIEQLGGYLEQTTGDGLLRDVEQFARRRPWMIAGIGMVAGLAASRFLKASSERRYQGTGAAPSTGSLQSGSISSVGGTYSDEPLTREYAATR